MERIPSYFSAAIDLLEGAGVLIIVAGSIAASVRFTFRLRRTAITQTYHELRMSVGRAIVMGLEFLIAGDIVRTVAVSHNVKSVLVLAFIVLIRSFLSMSIMLEVEGRWPWQAAAMPKQMAMLGATTSDWTADCAAPRTQLRAERSSAGTFPV
jgi:uncharacterized membrane protein